MKFEKITNSKIKILFTLEDMTLHNISAQAFLSNSSISQKILQDAINEAEETIGFQTDDSKLLVETILSSNGELIFTITKLSNCLNFDIFPNLIFKFENFDNFLSFCTYLKNIENIQLNNVFDGFSLLIYNNCYYLSIPPSNNHYFCNAILEFSSYIPYSCGFDGLISEYGKIILDESTINTFIENYV